MPGYLLASSEQERIGPKYMCNSCGLLFLLFILFQNGSSKKTCLQDETEFLPNEVSLQVIRSNSAMNRMIEETEEGDDNYSFRNNDEDKYDDDQCNHGGCDDRDYDATIVPGGDATVIDGFVVVVIPLAAAIVVVVVAVIVVRVFVGGGGGGGGGNGAGRGDLDQYMQDFLFATPGIAYEV